MQNQRTFSPALVAALAGAAATFFATHVATPATEVPAAVIATLAADAPTWLPTTDGTRLRDVPCMSAAEDAEFRLAHVLARDPAAYRGLESGASQDGQAVVLQTFDANPYRASGPGRLPDHVHRVGDGYFVRGEQRESLVAARGASGTWTYGIVETDGSVRASGTSIKLCLRCHASAPYDGLFGLDGSR